MPCQQCESERLAVVSAKSNDRNYITILDGPEHEGYIPGDMGIGSGDTIEFEYCLACGQIQGMWPLPETKLEARADYDL